jgi:hypothetical protein
MVMVDYIRERRRIMKVYRNPGNYLIARGYNSLDDVTPMYLWNCGNYKYEITTWKNKNFTKNEMLDTSYENAVEKFRMMVNTVNFVGGEYSILDTGHRKKK